MHDPSPSLRELRLNGIKMVHIAKKDLALADESYRDILARVTGLRSAGEMTAEQLGRVLDEFGRLGWKPKSDKRGAGSRPKAISRQARKARALWLSLWHLGEVSDPSEAALAHFAARQTGKEALQWIPVDDYPAVIEALKDWAARVGFSIGDDMVKKINMANGGALNPIDYKTAARMVLIRAQWDRLISLGVMHHGEHARLETWLRRKFSVSSPYALDSRQAARAVDELGAWLRRVMASSSAAASNEAE